MHIILLVVVVFLLMLGLWVGSDRSLQEKVVPEKLIKIYWERKVDRERLKKELLRDEGGIKLQAYKPVATEKHFTIGVGHYGADVTQGMKITKAQALEFFEKDIDTALQDVKALIGMDHPPQVLEGFANMAFQLGRTKLRKFTETIKLIKAKKYDAASIEMLDSNWAKQTKERAKRVSNKFKVKNIKEKFRKVSNG